MPAAKSAAKAPRADRPHMPDYNLAPARKPKDVLSWKWGRDRLVAAHNYWVATVCPDGRPHAMPVWGVWISDRFYFSTAPGSRKARNLARDPRCTITTEMAEEAVIVEGAVKLEKDRKVLAAFKRAYDKKYNWDMGTEGILRLDPRVAFGFIEHSNKFHATATRWTFAAKRRRAAAAKGAGK